MELKKLYDKDGNVNLVEPGSQAEQERLTLGWTDKVIKSKVAQKDTSEKNAPEGKSE